MLLIYTALIIEAEFLSFGVDTPLPLNPIPPLFTVNWNPEARGGSDCNTRKATQSPLKRSHKPIECSETKEISPRLLSGNNFFSLECCSFQFVCIAHRRLCHKLGCNRLQSNPMWEYSPFDGLIILPFNVSWTGFPPSRHNLKVLLIGRLKVHLAVVRSNLGSQEFHVCCAYLWGRS